MQSCAILDTGPVSSTGRLYAGMTNSVPLKPYAIMQGDFRFDLLPKGVRTCIIRC